MNPVELRGQASMRGTSPGQHDVHRPDRQDLHRLPPELVLPPDICQEKSTTRVDKPLNELTVQIVKNDRLTPAPFAGTIPSQTLNVFIYS